MYVSFGGQRRAAKGEAFGEEIDIRRESRDPETKPEMRNHKRERGGERGGNRLGGKREREVEEREVSVCTSQVDSRLSRLFCLNTQSSQGIQHGSQFQPFLSTSQTDFLLIIH